MKPSTNLTGISVFLLSFFNSSVVWGQDAIKHYVQNNTSEVRSISPDSSDYTDLIPIGDAIGDAKIVFLGEQDHGDAPTFLAKTKLIKYLHEKKGFDVLAFESDFFALTEGWDAVPHNKTAIDSFILRNIFGIWTVCDACSNLLYKYIPESFSTAHPLMLSGFDDQLFMSYTSKNLLPELDSVLKKWQISFTTTPEYTTEIWPLIGLYNAIKPSFDSNKLKKRSFYLEEIKKELITKTSPDNYWVVVIENMIQQDCLYLYTDKSEYWKKVNSRDIQMAHNLKWLAENKYPDKKIIVWAANYHVSKFNSHYPEDYLNEARTMGAEFTSDSLWRKKTYIIGFTSLYGTAGRLNYKIYDVPKPNKNSFERWIKSDYTYSFTDFKAYNNNNPAADEDFFMSGSIKGNSFHTNHKAQWNRIFDGVFFIRDMYPCKLAAINH